MHDLQELLAQHGGLAVVLAVFAEQLGAPLPSMPLLVLAGTWVALGRESFIVMLAAAAAAAMVANVMWFYVGRRMGVRVLGWLCKVSLSPDSCVRRNELSFARRGVWALLMAKFVPGLSMLASPVAGAMGMPPRQFIAYNLAGTLMWASAGLSIGWLVGDEFDRVLEVASGHALHVGLWGLVMLMVYLAWRGVRRWRGRHAGDAIDRISAQSLHQQLSDGADIVLVDVRVILPALQDPARVPGARHLDLSHLEVISLFDWPKGPRYVFFCSCPNDASAVAGAVWLGHHGREVAVLQGGIDAWLANRVLSNGDLPPLLAGRVALKGTP